MTEQDPAPQKFEPLPDQPWERVIDLVMIAGCGLLVWISAHIEGLIPGPPTPLFPALDWTGTDFNSRLIIHIITGSAVMEYLAIFTRINRFVPGDPAHPVPALRTRAILKAAMALYPWFCLIMLNLITGGGYSG